MNGMKRSVPQRHWLTSAAPLPELAAKWLLSHSNTPILDLSRWVVIVPTRNASRLLRENLAIQAQGRALLAPDVLTPAQFHSRATPPNAASPDEMLIAWTQVLIQTPPEHYEALLPQGLPSTPVSVAARMVDLEEKLSEGHWDLADPIVATHVPEEWERWQQIGDLARSVRRLLRQQGLIAPAEMAKEPSHPSIAFGASRHVLLVGVLELTPLLRSTLARWGEDLSIDILIHAPNFTKAEQEAFDTFGCPERDFWRETPLEWPTEGLKLVSDPYSLGEAVADRVATTPGKQSPPALVVADTRLRPSIGASLRNAGVPVFDPSGVHSASLPSIALLTRLLELEPSPPFAAVAEIARSPALLERFCESSGLGPSRFLIALDEFACRHIPVTLEAADQLVQEEGLRKAFEAFTAAATQAALLQPVQRAVFWVEWVWPSGRAKLPSHEFEHLRKALITLRSLRIDMQALDNQTATRLICYLLTQGRIYSEPEDLRSLELLGWLESGWFTQSGVILCGLHDGVVPEQVDAHPFLPESLRQRLGLPSNASREARDACLFQAVQRRCRGEISILLAQTASDQHSSLPSRFLLRAPKEHLLERISVLFEAPHQPHLDPARTTAWPLHLPLLPRPTSFRVTEFRDFLHDPLLHFFAQRLSMRPVERHPMEASPTALGEIFHSLMASLGRDGSFGRPTDISHLSGLASKALDNRFREVFGDHPPLSVLIQKAALKRKVRSALELQQSLAAEGWELVAVEWDIPPETIRFAERPLKGRIDRIDRHPDGRWRVIDYKTGNEASHATRTSLRRARSKDDVWPEHIFFVDQKGAKHRWLDLQLVLYSEAVARCFEGAEHVEAAYFNAPIRDGETQLSCTEFDQIHRESSLRCAQGIVDQIDSNDYLFAWNEPGRHSFESILDRDPKSPLPCWRSV